MKGLLAGFATLTLVAAVPGVAAASPPDRGSAAAPPQQVEAKPPHGAHNLPSPLAKKQNALTAKAQQMVLEGKAQPRSMSGDQVVKVAPGQYVELAREDEDSIWTVTGEFGDQVATHDHGDAGSITHEGPPGPLHNEIPKPDRNVDNTTIWAEDFSEEYYEELLFSQEEGANSMANFYIEQSSNRYTVTGDVTDWAQVPFNAASYGSDYCGGIVCADTWLFVDDSVDAWYERTLGDMSAAEINDYLSQFDVWDRYDVDGDGNFDESDGYIDHFQSVHAGVGQETGGGEQGSDAIWSHRWYAYFGGGGPDGAGPNGSGGVRVGNSDYWIGDYTIEPENGGVGVFAHEFAHDLGLPDLYDTSGNEGGAENSTAFWTLMSSGSYGSSGEPEDGIGTKPMHMGNWEKFQLGWLNYEIFTPGQSGKIKLGPAEFNTKQAQGAFVLLPDKLVPLELGDPYAGEHFYYSDSGDNLDNSMTKEVSIPAGGGQLAAQARYDIEANWDYAYLTVNGESVETSLSSTENPNGTNLGFGITGDTGGEWVELTADLSEYAGQTVTLGFRYVTDGAVTEPGFQVDQVTLDGEAIGSAEAEEGWTFDGFRTTTGSEQQQYFNAYVLENRQYLGYDESLRTGPYNFGFLDTKPNWVEHFPYQDGLLINYWDSSYTDNNVGDHPGSGLLLPVDAHPRIMHWRDRTMMRPRLQSFDSTFGLESTPRLTLHNNGVPTRIGPKQAVPMFDDSRQGHWWRNCDRHACTGAHAGHYQPGWSSVNVPDTGTTVRVINNSGPGGTSMQVSVNGG